MQIFVSDPIQQTILFSTVLSIICVLTFFKKENYTHFSLTRELKGFAILAIIFGHIGFALSSNQQFLFPLSILAGVGVNLFLFLSGYGLTCSQLNRGGSIVQFYKKRLLKLFIPFWIVLSVVFLLSYFLRGETYSSGYIFQSMLGIFTSADMYTDINSPLWYFSLILFYYVLFPLVFTKRYAWITVFVLYLILYFVVKMDPPLLSGVIGLYQVHTLAFPLGVLAAWYVNTPRVLLSACKELYKRYEVYLYPAALLVLCAQIGYFAIHSNVGELAYVEEITSLYIMFAIIMLFMIKKIEFKVLSVFGFFSYEIYLFHWPLLYRFDFLYIHLPAGLATLLYLGIFLVVSLVLNNLILKVQAVLPIHK